MTNTDASDHAPTRKQSSATFEIKVAVLGAADVGKATWIGAVVRDKIGKNENGGSYDIQVNGKLKQKQNGGGADETSSLLYAAEIEMLPDTVLTFDVIPSQCQTSTYFAEKWENFDAVIVVIDGKKGISEEDVTLLKTVKEEYTKREIPLLIACNKIDNTDDEKLNRHVTKCQTKVEKIFAKGTTTTETDTPTDTNGNSSGSNPTCIAVSALHAYIYRTGARMTEQELQKDLDKELLDVAGKMHFGSKSWKKMNDKDKLQKVYAILTDPKQSKEGITDSGFDKVLQWLEQWIGGHDTQKAILQRQIEQSLCKMSPLQKDWISYTVYTAYQKQMKLGIENDGTALREAFWKTFQEYQVKTFQNFANAFPDKVHMVADPFEELMYYHKLVVLAKNWQGEEEKIVDKMKDMVRSFIHFLIQRQHETAGNSLFSWQSNISPIDWSIIWRSILLLSYEKYYCEMFGREKIMVEALCHEACNWKASNDAAVDKTHCPHCSGALDETKKKPVYPRCRPCSIVFLPGKELAAVESCVYCSHGKLLPDLQKTLQCENCKYKHEEFPNIVEWLKFSYDNKCKVVPMLPEKYQRVVHLEILESLNDPNHYGHVAYKFCNFIASLKQDNAKSPPAEEEETMPLEKDSGADHENNGGQ